MNVRRVNSVLWLGTAALSVAAIASLALSVMAPLARAEDDDPRATPVPARAIATTKPSLPPLADFQPLWSLTLRQNLGPTPPPDARPPTAAASATPASTGTPPPFTLVGTIGTSLAMLRTPANVVEVCAVGESLAGATVVAVRPAEVDLKYNGQVVTLAKPKEPASR